MCLIYSIVFVHGLNPLNTQDFAEKTWTHANGTLWPRDILPSNVPECRILLFGYNSNVAFDVSNQGIKDHANTLLDRLGRNRKVTEVNSLLIKRRNKKSALEKGGQRDFLLAKFAEYR
jgi:hypothetical protein